MSSSQADSRPQPPAPAQPLLGMGTALALLVGASFALGLPEFPPTALIWSCLAAGLGLLPWPRALAGALRLLGAFLLGASVTLLSAQTAMQQRLPAALEGIDLQVEGRIEGLPQYAPDSIRFDFRVDAGMGEAAVLAGRLLRIGWYRSSETPAAGSRWALTLRLKAPRGVDNPGGFDFERYALQRRLAATGYVREAASNRELAPPSGLDALRARLSQQMVEALGGEGPTHADSRFVRALSLADTRGFGEQDWETLRATGVSHLMSISGMHIGLLAGLAALLVRVLYRLWPPLGLRLPLPQGAATAALLMAAGYAALAGFGLPTVRSLLMIAAALLAVLLRRSSGPWQAYALALIVLVLSDPLSVLGAGFWLSFIGVAWLLWCMPTEFATLPGWRRLLGTQLVASLGLLPLTVFFFGQASIAGAVANLFAVPWVSLLVVPLSLIGAGLLLLGANAPAAWLLWLAAQAMDLLWWLLQWMAALPHAQAFLPAPDLFALALAGIGALWLLLPRGLPAKPLAVLLWLPLLWPRTPQLEHGEAALTVLDVGQGLAVLVRTREHAMLVDTGPAFGSGLDMGEAAVVPALRALGVPRLQRVLVSHGDADHAGGAGSVLRAFPAELISSDRQRFPQASGCESGQSWEWDGVRFEILHPPPHFPYLRNESSCVLRVEARGSSALLAGDIGALIEARLVREQPDMLQADVVLVPHHGSGSSSTEGFVQAVGAQHALIAAGHRNRFGHPRADVVARWQAAGAEVWNTADQGALELKLDDEDVIAVEARRASHRRLWKAEPAIRQ
jgi:competence protein ComEC